MGGPRSALPGWSDLQHFAAVARAGSIAAAAQALGVNHSTVLRRIASLETTLGARLFDRLPSGYALTATGNEVAENLGGIAERIEAAQRRLLGLGEAIEGGVQVEAPDTVVDALLMPLLAAFRREHRRVFVALTVGAGGARPRRPGADLVLRVGEAPAGARCVGAIEAVLCTARGAGAAARAVPLAQQRWVVAETAPSFAAFERWRRQHVADERVALRIDSLLGAADAIAAGLGIGLLPRPLAMARSELVELDTPVTLPPEPLTIAVHPDAQGTARVQRLAAFLVERLGTDPRLQH